MPSPRPRTSMQSSIVGVQEGSRKIKIFMCRSNYRQITVKLSSLIQLYSRAQGTIL